jgi:hypothetical protein
MIFLGPKTHSNIGLVIACNFAIINKSTYFTPTARLKLYKGIRGSKISWEASVGYSYTNIQSKLDSRITPEAGFSYRHIHLSYGYNIPLTNYTDNYTNSNRIALRYGGW